MQTINSIIKICLFAVIIFSSIFATPVFSQSIFSGLILTEAKDGLRVVDAQPGSPAFDAGLKVGDEVVEIDGKKIKSLDDYVRISKNVRSKKIDARLVVRRKGLLYEAIIRTYSMPIYRHWEQKAAKPGELPSGLTDSPFTYWTNKGKTALKGAMETVPFEEKVKNYNEAIKFFFNSLHCQVESIDTALLIARLYHELGNIYFDNGKMDTVIKYYRYAITLNTNCLKKTQKEDYLKLILANLQEIEKGLSKVDKNKVGPSSEATKE